MEKETIFRALMFLSFLMLMCIVPVAAYAILVAIRVPQEEKVLEGVFGQQYAEYKKRTGGLVPRLRTDV